MASLFSTFTQELKIALILSTYQPCVKALKMDAIKFLRVCVMVLKGIENLAIILVPLIMILSRGHTGQIKG